MSNAPALPPFDAPGPAWQAYAAALGAYALGHEVGQTIELEGTPSVIVYQRGYPAGADQRPGAAEALAAKDMVALRAAMGTPHSVYGSQDGRQVRSKWCACGAAAGQVYYARFSPCGQTTHGWACVECRGITQTG